MNDSLKCGSANAGSPASEPHLQTVCARLNGNVDSFAKLLMVLKEKLTPIVRPVAPTAKAEQKMLGPMVPLAEAIRNHCINFEDLLISLEDLISRVEV